MAALRDPLHGGLRRGDRARLRAPSHRCDRANPDRGRCSACRRARSEDPARRAPSTRLTRLLRFGVRSIMKGSHRDASVVPILTPYRGAEAAGRLLHRTGERRREVHSLHAALHRVSEAPSTTVPPVARLVVEGFEYRLRAHEPRRRGVPLRDRWVTRESEWLPMPFEWTSSPRRKQYSRAFKIPPVASTWYVRARAAC